MPPSPRRPNLSRAVRQLIRDVSRRLPEFAHVKADRIVVVAGEARRASRATVRPMRFPDGTRVHGSRRKPSMSFRGHDVLYVVTLRPLFFRTGSAEKRVETVLHELLHLSPRFDGSLDPARRHAVIGDRFEQTLRPLVKRYLAACPTVLLDRLNLDGDVLVRQWLEKPPGSFRVGTKARRRYTEAQTFLGPVRMVTRGTHH